MKYNNLVQQHPRFIFESFSQKLEDDALVAEYTYIIDNLDTFTTRWSFPLSGKAVDITALKPYLLALGMAELASYWKLTCSPQIIIKPKAIGTDEANWWKKLYFHGLGEFFYINTIEADMDSFVSITGSEDAPIINTTDNKENLDNNSIIIPIGGGKDSIVTLELLKPYIANSLAYTINSKESTYTEAKIAGFSDNQIITPTRTLDRKIIKYNNEGFLNGHTPYSAIVAFSSLITAVIYGKKNIALSNEASANEPSIIGSSVNHQYSKSFEFEQDFNHYTKVFLSSGVEYFSFLRVFHEIQIAAIFSNFKQYHSVFRSCNVGSKTDSWCGRCAKCLFVALILSPFLTQKEITSIIGSDMLENPDFYPTLLELTGKTNNKPFECVGTIGEVEHAIALTITNAKKAGINPPLLLNQYKKDCVVASLDALDFFGYFNEENLVPNEFLPILQSWKDDIYHEYNSN